MSFADFFWGIIVFYFWFMVIWIWIRCFADLFHRRDLTGAWKVIWTVVLLFIPFLGSLVYMLVRKPTEQDVQEVAAMEAAQKRAAGFSAADEVAKLQALKDAGTISQAEFDAAKARALA